MSAPTPQPLEHMPVFPEPLPAPSQPRSVPAAEFNAVLPVAGLLGVPFRSQVKAGDHVTGHTHDPAGGEAVDGPGSVASSPCVAGLVDRQRRSPVALLSRAGGGPLRRMKFRRSDLANPEVLDAVIGSGNDEIDTNALSLDKKNSLLALLRADPSYGRKEFKLTWIVHGGMCEAGRHARV